MWIQHQTRVKIWIRIMDLPQKFWQDQTLFEIASGVGTPLTLDDPTQNMIFNHYARILVDMDLSK